MNVNPLSYEFWGSFIGSLIGIIVVWTPIYWYGSAREEKRDGIRKLIPMCLAVLTIDLYGVVCFKIPARHEGISEGQKIVTGLPVNSELDGHTFTPLAFVITEHRILVYDKDEKVYALDGIKLDKDLTPETLTVGTNISYTVFTKAGQLYFGRLGS